jgi:cytochrome c peroxidase
MRFRTKTLSLFLPCAWLLTCSLDYSDVSPGTLDLENKARAQFSPLPATMAAEANPLTPEKIRLGKILFYETRISIDGTVSCARCHPFSLYGADGLKTSVGNHCAVNPRNAPTLLNAAAQIAQHWIGNRTDVEDQARQSVVGAASFGMPSPAAVEDRLRRIKGYGPLFAAAFPGESEPITVAHLAEAIGAFERTLVSPSRFDAFLTGNASAMGEKEKKGLEAFMDIGCASCHSGTYVGGGMFSKFGIAAPFWELTKSEKPDEGRFTATKKEEDRYVFKVPILRNIARTPPYFHDGSVEALVTAITIMARAQLGLDISPEERSNILAFLEALTGKIPEDALELPELPAAEEAAEKSLSEHD